MSAAQIHWQRIQDEREARLDAEEQARRDAREKLTGKPWWDMPCRRGECPGFPSSMTGCCGRHPDAQTPEDES